MIFILFQMSISDMRTPMSFIPKNLATQRTHLRIINMKMPLMVGEVFISSKSFISYVTNEFLRQLVLLFRFGSWVELLIVFKEFRSCGKFDSTFRSIFNEQFVLLLRMLFHHMSPISIFGHLLSHSDLTFIHHRFTGFPIFVKLIFR